MYLRCQSRRCAVSAMHQARRRTEPRNTHSIESGALAQVGIQQAAPGPSRRRGRGSRASPKACSAGNAPRAHRLRATCVRRDLRSRPAVRAASKRHAIALEAPACGGRCGRIPAGLRKTIAARAGPPCRLARSLQQRSSDAAAAFRRRRTCGLSWDRRVARLRRCGALEMQHQAVVVARQHLPQVVRCAPRAGHRTTEVIAHDLRSAARTDFLAPVPQREQHVAMIGDEQPACRYWRSRAGPGVRNTS